MPSFIMQTASSVSFNMFGRHSVRIFFTCEKVRSHEALLCGISSTYLANFDKDSTLAAHGDHIWLGPKATDDWHHFHQEWPGEEL